MKLLCRLIFCILCAAPSAWAGERPLNVVATLSTFADLVSTIGGDDVTVSAVASPKFNPHFIEPKPSDVLKVKRADLFVHAGLDLEAGWRGPLLDAAGNRDVMAGGEGELDLAQGIALLEVPVGVPSRAQGDIHIYGNPHYWLDPRNGGIMAQAICDKLCAVDPAHCPHYQERLEAWQRQLDARMAEWRSRLAPLKGRELVGHHNEWPYLMQFAGLTMESFLEPKPGIPPTPKQIELVQRHVSARGIPAVVQASFEPRTAADAVAKRTGTVVAVLCQNVGELPACGTYLDMVGYNVDQLVALCGGEGAR